MAGDEILEVVDTPLWVRLAYAADALGDAVKLDPWGPVSPEMADTVRGMSERLKQEALDAAARDQLLEDIGSFLYRQLEPDTVSDWGMLPADHPVRVRYRNVAERLTCSFEVGREEAPF